MLGDQMNPKIYRVLFLIGFVITTLILPHNAAGARPGTVSITSNKFAAGSVEAFAAMVLRKARNKEFSALKPFFTWTWNDFYHNWGPDFPWKTVARAKSDSDIYLYPVGKSKLHKDVYTIAYYALTQEGVQANASFIVLRDDQGFKLGVQANASDIGNHYVKLGHKKTYVDRSFKSIGSNTSDIKQVDDTTTIYTLKNGATFRCTYGKNATIERLEQKLNDSWVELYLIIFDLEGTPTIKLKI
jgi:hypothetical protein